MGEDRFKTVVKALITNHGDILVGKGDEENESVSGEWHMIEGYLQHGQDIEKAIKKQVNDQTGLEVDIHQTIDIMTFSPAEDEKDSVQILFHCVADSRNAEALQDLEEVRWVGAEDFGDQLDQTELDRIQNRPEQAKFIEKIEKTPY